ncbi:DUF2516 family protein [Georgenia sp. 10Sc9-8]|uniref:DUF2516 family protein n=1 Tax=Georgenia halotolerans TaxID=3028317 RepID=A0ABT5TYS1_9MICO|nr:DUF2516 family protein [Georgenia halotolerans]
MLGTVQVYVFLILAIALFVVEVWALVDAARRPTPAFTTAGKRTKNFWLLLLAVGAVVGFLNVPVPGGAGTGTFLMFIAVVPAGIYLADVRPAVSGYSGRRPPRGGGW